MMKIPQDDRDIEVGSIFFGDPEETFEFHKLVEMDNDFVYACSRTYDLISEGKYLIGGWSVSVISDPIDGIMMEEITNPDDLCETIERMKKEFSSKCNHQSSTLIFEHDAGSKKFCNDCGETFLT